MSARGRRTTVTRSGARRELVVTTVFAVVVMVLVGLGAAFACRQVAQVQALDDSERRSERLTKTLAPLVKDVLDEVPGADSTLQRAIAERVSPDDLTEITVWAADGSVVASADPDEAISPGPPSAEVTQAVNGGHSSEVTADEPESGNGNPTLLPGRAERYVEVYWPMPVEGHGTLAFEAYFDYANVDRVATGLQRAFLPLVLIPLLLLQAIQIPVALSLARRLRVHEEERATLLEEALSVSDRERVRFAADLHDGPIQDLAGISYALGAVAPTVAEKHTALMGRVQDALQRSIQSLRGLMTDLYPPDLRTGTLDQAVATLAEPLRAEGIDVDLDLQPAPGLSDDAVGAFYRVARESLANVGKHAQAGAVTVRLETFEPVKRGDHAVARLTVADDGVGLDPSRLDRRAEGHLGLRLLSDRVKALGGTLTITSAAGEGTTVEAELPMTAGVS